MTFDKRITIQRKVKQGTGSFAPTEWKDICTVWANWVNVHGSEVWAADSVQALKPATVTIRYSEITADIDEKYRLVYKGKAYEIVSADNIKERNRFIELKVRAAVNG